MPEIADDELPVSARAVLVGSCLDLLWKACSLGEECTPAMAAGLTNHCWTKEELLTFLTPPAELPGWRGRKPR
jgi:hypothetical protein